MSAIGAPAATADNEGHDSHNGDLPERSDREARSARLSADKLAKWAKRPNVHLAMHYNVAIDQYATLWNVMVLVGENYHRQFKAWVTLTNHRDVELHLLSKDVRFKTIRFVLHGAFAYSHSEATKSLKTLLEVCPTVMESFLPPSSRFYLEPDEQGIASDAGHINCRVFQKYTRQQVRTMAMPLQPNSNGTAQWFTEALRMAYELHYKKPNMYEFGAKPVQYWKKFTFIAKTSELRLGFTCGSHVAILGTNSFGTIDHIITHESPDGLTRLFLVLRRLRVLEQRDWLANIPLLQATSTLEVVGLPIVSPQRPYIVSTNGTYINHDTPPGDDILWLCDWNVNFA